MQMNIQQYFNIWIIAYCDMMTSSPVEDWKPVYLSMSLSLSLYIYIYIYIFTNLISTSIHGTKKKKNEKPPPGTRDKSILNHRPGEKEKNIGQKERKGQPRPTPWKKSRDTQSVGQKKTKTFRESCNATITKVLNTRGANHKINLIRESEIFSKLELGFLMIR